MSSAAQFRPAPPPALTSETWTRDFNEIREIGGLNSKTRTRRTDRHCKILVPDRSAHLQSHRAAGCRAQADGSARLRAAVRAGVDGGRGRVHRRVRCEVHFNFWRPVTAIRNADQSGNPRTPRDAGLAAARRNADASGISLRALHHLVGGGRGIARRGRRGGRRDHSHEPHGAGCRSTMDATSTTIATRCPTRASGPGFHYRFSTEVGKDMGKKIGELTIATQLRPRK